MRYSSHPPRAFRNRIARYLGVLVGAALIATLGLPSAVQAQTPAAPTVIGAGDGTTGADDATINATWGAGGLTDQTGWKVEYTEPGEPWADAIAVDVVGPTASTLPVDDVLEANDPGSIMVSGKCACRIGTLAQ